MNRLYRVFAILLLPMATFAQSITLEQCREMALENSFSLKSSNEKIAAADDIFRAYKTNYLPNFSLKGGYLYSALSFSETIEGGFLPTYSPNETTGALEPNISGVGADGTPIFSSYAYMPDIELDFKVGSLFTAGVHAAQPIYMGGKISNATKLAKVGVDVAKIDHSRTEVEVLLAADRAFYTYIKVEQMVESANAYRTVMDELCRKVESMLKNGMCTKNDLLKVQVKVGEAELMQLKAQNGLILARMNLCYIMGLALDSREIEVVDDFDSQMRLAPTLDVTTRPEYALLEKNIEAKELEVRLSQGDFLPSVSALASYTYANGMTINNEKVLGSAPAFAGGVMVNVPIFHWGEGRRKVSAARREVEIAKNSKSDLVQKMTLELMQSINGYNEAQLQVSLMERNLEQAAQNLKQSQKSYEAGMDTLSELLEAQALWQKSMGDLVEAKSNQRLSYASYLRCKGK